jgi:hypothetical protein
MTLHTVQDLLNGVNGSVVGASRLAKLQSLGQSVKNLGSVCPPMMPNPKRLHGAVHTFVC